MDSRGGGTLRKRAIDPTRADTAVKHGKSEEIHAAGENEEPEPVSPTGRLFREPHFNCYIVSVFGLGAPVDLPAVRAGLEATLARHPRFHSVQVRTRLRSYATFCVHALCARVSLLARGGSGASRTIVLRRPWT